MLDQSAQSILLTHAMLTSLAGALPTMDPRRVRSIGMSVDQARRMAQLTTADMIRLADRGVGWIQFQIDPELLSEALEELDREADHQSLVHEFIERDASREMMAELFSVPHRQYARLRQSLGLPSGAGRPKECSLDDAQHIFDAWTEHGSARNPETLLAIARQLGISLRVIWDEIAQYSDEDDRRAVKSVA